MRYAYALAAFAGLATALPNYDAQPQGQKVQKIHWVVETVVETVYVTEGAKPTYKGGNNYHYAPAPAPAKPTPVKGGNYGSGYMGVVNKWRSNMGLSPLQQSGQLESNARKCVTESNGQMVHELNPGSYGQVLAPGSEGDFEHVFVGGWLCERPSLLGAQGSSVCSQQGQGWDHQGQTGHADILSSGQYSKIGCALYAGIWGCDLA
jgi:hypothetical protein